uniref:Arb2 domain-containing protein n=1 Tax=Pelusios castaneus TaxID=367368 RepID=A0A8C8R4N9_9SAUR
SLKQRVSYSLKMNQLNLKRVSYGSPPLHNCVSFRKLVESSECPEQLKYDFNKNGELKHLDTNEPFVFNYYKNAHESNHKRYQVLGQLIAQYVYELLERVCKLQKVHIPTDATENEPRSFFFMSDKALTNSSSLIVLLQDRGVFRAGQWGQKTIIHEGLNHGTQIPFIKRYSSSPEEHTIYIWDHFISKSAAKNVAFIAHGYGGLVFINLLMQRTWEVMNKVYSVALIDSMHHMLHQARNNPQVQEWIQKHCRQWVTNSKPLDRPTGSLLKVDCPSVSAGTEKYSLAPSSTLQAIFKYLKSALKAKNTVAFSRSPIVTRSNWHKKQHVNNNYL